MSKVQSNETIFFGPRCFAPGPVVGRGAAGRPPQGVNMDAATRQK